MTRSIDARVLKRWLSEPDEIALLDVREAGQFGEGHLFFAIPLPFSRLEIDMPRLVPSRAPRVVLVADDEVVARRACACASALGYRDVQMLAGGTRGWSDAGYRLFKGVNVPSKTFGEIVEHARGTPRITPEELVRRTRRGDDLIVVDGRPLAEYGRMSIPGGICCPNGELALRIGLIAPDPATTIVVNCAGRTRSIIGAQTLIDAGVPNPVLALENGTQGWFLAGLELERGAARHYPAKADATPLRRARVAALAARCGVGTVAAGTVGAWLADASRTTYVLDVRTAEEVATEGLAGAEHAPGGQLIQATDQWVGVKGSRIVLVDGEGIRAPMTAAWLRQLGHDAHVLEGGARSGVRIVRADPPTAGIAALPEVSVVEAAQQIASGRALAVDLRPSMVYRRMHVAGSVWSIRLRLGSALAGSDQPVIFIADDARTAALAAREIATGRSVTCLAGGFEAWQRAGHAVAASPDAPADAECIDYLFFTHDRHDGNAAAARQYLAWETGLLAELDEQERGVFRIAGDH